MYQLSIVMSAIIIQRTYLFYRYAHYTNNKNGFVMLVVWFLKFYN